MGEPEKLPATIGRYEVQRVLGSGAMGSVVLAEDPRIKRKVAIKILSQDFAHKADLVQRFIQEARAAARIGHENIVEVYDFGETASGSVFFAMEYLYFEEVHLYMHRGKAMGTDQHIVSHLSSERSPNCTV